MLLERQVQLNWLMMSSFGREVSVRLDVLVLVPATILLAVAASTLDRFHRFVFVYPAILTLFSFLIPLFIIFKNEKIKTFADRNYLEPTKRQFEGVTARFIFLYRKRRVKPLICVSVWDPLKYSCQWAMLVTFALSDDSYSSVACVIITNVSF